MDEKKPNKDRDWEEVLPRGDHELVALNTLIPRKMSERLGQAVGLLQTQSPRLRQTKQATVQHLLDNALNMLFEDWERQDRVPSVKAEETPSIEKAEDINVSEIIKQQSSKGYDLKTYTDIGNKPAPGYKPNR
jgi:hypothetical protein